MNRVDGESPTKYGCMQGLLTLALCLVAFWVLGPLAIVLGSHLLMVIAFVSPVVLLGRSTSESHAADDCRL
jgi:Na+/H+-dicarboxylate symporter